MDDRMREKLLAGREHYQKHEFDKAQELLSEVAERHPGFADVANMLGVMAHERGDYGLAEKHFEHAIDVNPNYSEAQLNLAVTYNDQGKYEAARGIYQQIRATRQKSQDRVDPFVKGKIANLHADVSLAYEEAGLINEAIRELEHAVALCPHFADLRTRLGTMCRDAGNLTRAREQFEAACLANPHYVHARIMLGVTLLSLNEVDAAIAQWRTVLETDPTNKSARMYLRVAESARRLSRPAPAS